MRVVTLDKRLFDQRVSQLCESTYQPDLVIAILTGGGYVLDSIKRQNLYETTNMIEVSLQRTSTKRKNHKLLTYLLKKSPYRILNWLRLLESYLQRRSVDSKEIRELGTKDSELLRLRLNQVENVLIVDDAIDTGKTMSVVIAKIREYNPSIDINVSVISWTIVNSLVKPDNFCYKNVLVRFPWSKDYKGDDSF